MRLAAGLRPDPLGELEQLGVPTFKAGREGKGKEGMGKGKGGKGSGGEGWKGKDDFDLHTTLFLGPDYISGNHNESKIAPRT